MRTFLTSIMTVLLCLAAFSAIGADAISVVPWPVQLEAKGNTFILNAKTRVVAEAGTEADGKVVGQDRHRGFTGIRHKNNIYRVHLAEFTSGARYELRVSARSEGGTDSAGDVFIR